MDAEVQDEYGQVYLCGAPWVNELSAAVQVLVKDRETGDVIEKSKKVVSAKQLIFPSC